MRTLLTAVLFVACSNHDTRSTDDHTMSNSQSRLEVVESVTDISVVDVAVSPVDPTLGGAQRDVDVPARRRPPP